MPFDERAFRKTLGCFASGVTVVTALHPVTRALAGVTVSAFSSLSLNPPLVLFCLGARTSSIDAFRECGHFGINVLAENQRDLSNRFSSRAADKWEGVRYETWDSGVPILGGCLANLECRLVDAREGGDHLIFIGQPTRIRHQEGGSPLLYFRGGYMDLPPPGCGGYPPKGE